MMTKYKCKNCGAEIIYNKDKQVWIHKYSQGFTSCNDPDPNMSYPESCNVTGTVVGNISFDKLMGTISLDKSVEVIVYKQKLSEQIKKRIGEHGVELCKVNHNHTTRLLGQIHELGFVLELMER